MSTWWPVTCRTVTSQYTAVGATAGYPSASSGRPMRDPQLRAPLALANQEILTRGCITATSRATVGEASSE
jgi:hypothetical protein